MRRSIGRLTRQGLALVLSAVIVTVPTRPGEALAQSSPFSARSEQSHPSNNERQGPQVQPLSPAQLDQLVAPVALYPDALLAQILAAATYPTQVVEADRWRQAQGNVPAEQIAASAEVQPWDPSVKALTTFPAVLAQMDRNIRWTNDLGNAYYNQPQDVIDSVQALRQKAQAAGHLRSTSHQLVTDTGGVITITPANPAVVCIPVYNPWEIYGAPLPAYPGYSYAPLPVVGGSSEIGFGSAITIGFFAHRTWGWDHWELGWQNHAVLYNRATYLTRSTTVINHGFNLPGGPPRNVGPRGAYAWPYEGFSHPDRGVPSLGAGSDPVHNNTALARAAPARATSDFTHPVSPADRPWNSGEPTLWPVDGRITGAFGERIDPFNGEGAFHSGVDISSPYGHSVVVPADGTVVYAAFTSGYGRMVMIEHGHGFSTRYGHLSGFGVVEGQRVKRGDILGYVGMSGRATGPHLHYEVWLHDTPVNPYPYLRITQAQFHGAAAGD